MNSNSVLSSNLLDIIFENKNKDYGAYVLRKDYNKRLFKSLVMALTLAVILIFLLMFARKNGTTKLITISPFIPPNSVSAIKIIEPEKHSHNQVKPHKSVSEHPVIVEDNKVQKEVSLDTQIIISTVGDIVPSFEGPVSEVTNTGGEEIKQPEKPSVAGVDKAVPVNSPEVLPQFPGGTKELIKFLRRNLNTPHPMEDGEEIGVKIKFIVNYNGDLMGFDVIETGGEPFDNEVIRY